MDRCDSLPHSRMQQRHRPKSAAPCHRAIGRAPIPAATLYVSMSVGRSGLPVKARLPRCRRRRRRLVTQVNGLTTAPHSLTLPRLIGIHQSQSFSTSNSPFLIYPPRWFVSKYCVQRFDVETHLAAGRPVNGDTHDVAPRTPVCRYGRSRAGTLRRRRRARYHRGPPPHRRGRQGTRPRRRRRPTPPTLSPPLSTAPRPSPPPPEPHLAAGARRREGGPKRSARPAKGPDMQRRGQDTLGRRGGPRPRRNPSPPPPAPGPPSRPRRNPSPPPPAPGAPLPTPPAPLTHPRRRRPCVRPTGATSLPPPPAEEGRSAMGWGAGDSAAAPGGLRRACEATAGRSPRPGGDPDPASPAWRGAVGDPAPTARRASRSTRYGLDRARRRTKPARRRKFSAGRREGKGGERRKGGGEGGGKREEGDRGAQGGSVVAAVRPASPGATRT